MLGTLYPDMMRVNEHQQRPSEQQSLAQHVLAESTLRAALNLPVPTMWLHAMEEHSNDSTRAAPAAAPAAGPLREAPVQMWAESVRRKRFSKMKKHKHRKRLKKLRRQVKK